MKYNYSFINIAMFIAALFCFNTSYSQKVPDSILIRQVNTITNPLERLMTLEPAVYRYNGERYKGIQLPKGNQYGFLPENVEIAFPELVNYRNYSYSIGKNMFRTAKIKDVDLSNLIPFLVGSLKEQQAELEKLKEEIKLMKKEYSKNEH